MRILFLIAFSVFLCFAASGQKVAVALDCVNMVYKYIKNPVTVVVEGYKQKDIVLKSNDLDIIVENGNYALVPPPGAPKVCKVYVGINQKRNKIKWLDTFTFHTIDPFDFDYACFGTRTSTDKRIVYGELLTVRFISTCWSSFAPQKLWSVVIGSRVTVISKDLIFTKNIAGTKIDSEVLEIFRNIKGGSIIIVDSIAMQLSDREEVVYHQEYISKDVIGLWVDKKDSGAAGIHKFLFTSESDSIDIEDFNKFPMYLSKWKNKNVQIKLLDADGNTISTFQLSNGEIKFVK